MNNSATHLSRHNTSLWALASLMLLELVLIVSWSGGFIGVRFASDHAPIFLILLWRSLVSGLILLPFALLIGPRLKWEDILPQIGLGILAMSGYLAGFALAISLGVPTGLVALITDMLPLVVALLSWPMLGQALTAQQWLGSALGLVGVLIASGWSVQMGNVPIWAYILPILGTTSLALATLLQKRSRANTLPVHQSLCIQCLSAAAIFALFAWNEGGVMPVMELNFIGGILWLVFIATFGAWGLYYLALKKSSATRVTAILYLSPPVTMLWAWVMFDEPLSWAMMLGLLVSLLGIIIIARAQPRPAVTQA
ncbi:DMT family transporter [uncultured Thiothrix sp.]|uniref:DMT family transporter n=1 Tax=uncultured Thiothrix sp. TaxID=223185 RepID=UPI002631B98C|nr:DMT family transporter [uncultured Thiothrix sp.]